jgi:tRNA(Ser,Leu) C12 N-acetylase TAN1
MSMNFNLIASTFKHREEDAQDELLEILELLGDYESESQATDISGIVLGYTKLDPFKIKRISKE